MCVFTVGVRQAAAAGVQSHDRQFHRRLAAAAPREGSFVPINAANNKAETSMVAMVTPEIGLFELPTSPAI